MNFAGVVWRAASPCYGLFSLDRKPPSSGKPCSMYNFITWWVHSHLPTIRPLFLSLGKELQKDVFIHVLIHVEDQFSLFLDSLWVVQAHFRLGAVQMALNCPA